MACAYVPVDLAPLQSILGYIDCQALTIGEQGYLALAAPGSIASLLLTALLTTVIALFGYRMLLGRVPELGETVLLLVKIGIVGALATGWAGYRTLFYDVALRGPAELASVIGAPAGLPGTRGGLVEHLELVDQQFQALAIAGIGGRLTDFQPPPMFAGFDAFALGGARVTFLIGVLGAFAATRLLAGLLLALGPLFIASLLFEGTRGLFEGWLRVLIGAALAALATTIALSVETAMLEPWLADLLARRAAEQFIPGAPAPLLAATVVFAIVLFAMIVAMARVASGFRLRLRWVVSSTEYGGDARLNQAASLRSAGPRVLPLDGRSRAAALADSLVAAERREISGVGSSIAAVGAPAAASLSVQERTAAEPRASPVAGGRRVGSRVSASAGRRDAAQ